MSPRIRLLISDIDGTLVRNDKTLSDAVVAAVGRAQAAGLTVSLISARPPSGMMWIAKSLGITGPVAAFNGGTIVEPNGTIVSAEHLDPAVSKRVLDLIDLPDVTPWLFSDGNWYAQSSQTPYVPLERLAANMAPVIRCDFDALTARVDKIIAVSGNADALTALEAKLRAELGGSATVTRSQLYYLDVTSPHGNKGSGVSALADAYGISLTQVAVLGDQDNDLAMFDVAGFSVAMGQAAQNVREAASAVATSNEQDGAADAIDRLILPLA